MPIYSDNDAEAEDRLASLLAGAGATSSLAAAGAAVLSADPAATLSPRLKAALEAMVSLFENATAMSQGGPADVDSSTARFPEELVARLASQADPENADQTTPGFIAALLDDLQVLLNHPTSEAAARLESILGTLSRMENALAQSLARGSLELEVASLAIAS